MSFDNFFCRSISRGFITFDLQLQVSFWWFDWGFKSASLASFTSSVFAGARYNCLHVYDHGLLRIPHMAMQIKLVGIAANTAALHYIPFVYPIDNRPDKYLVVSL